jgi:hypothetical protein
MLFYCAKQKIGKKQKITCKIEKKRTNQSLFQFGVNLGMVPRKNFEKLPNFGNFVAI